MGNKEEEGNNRTYLVISLAYSLVAIIIIHLSYPIVFYFIKKKTCDGRATQYKSLLNVHKELPLSLDRPSNQPISYVTQRDNSIS